MSKPVPRSRLNITYRTKIEGQPKKAKLPMRFLVLGNFTGKNETPLGERELRSVMPGMQLDSFMQELRVTSPIDDRLLQETLKGSLVGTVTGVLDKKPAAGDKEGKVKLTGTGVVSGQGKDNGLGNFAGEVVIKGEAKVPLENGLPKYAEPIEIEVSLAGKVEPPSSNGAEGVTGTVDRKVKVKLGVNQIGDDVDTSIDLRSEVTGQDVPVALTIPLRSLGDFKPSNIAGSVPEIRRLVLLRRLVLELRAYISGNPELRNAFKAALAGTEAQIKGKAPGAGKETDLGKLTAELRTQYPQLLVPAE